MEIDPDQDKVWCEHRRLYRKSCEKQYFLFYKPRGVITAMKAQDDRSVIADLIGGIKGRVYPVGRLDRDSEGLLILTDDGDLAQRLAHPSHETPKTYRVTVRGSVSQTALEALRAGVRLDDDTVTKPAEVTVHRADENKTVLHISITEGKNRQIRRMCETLGLDVMLLKRIAVGDLLLGHLAPGAYRPLTEKEKEMLLTSVGLPYVRKSAAPDNRKKWEVHRASRRGNSSIHERRFKKQFGGK